jgi:putative membrane protein
MGRRLYRFTTILAVPALLLGLWLMMLGMKGGWLHAKLALVVLVIGYHHACGSLLKKFERGTSTRSPKWFRVFNEVPVLLLVAIVILVVVKPF